MRAVGEFRGRQMLYAEQYPEVLETLRHAAMQEKILNAYLGGIVDQPVFEAKSATLKTELADLKKLLETEQQFEPAKGEGAIQIFDFSQKAADLWEGSNNVLKCELLETLSLNRTVSDVSLCLIKRKPFDILAERPRIGISRGDRT